jgi:hypothetical protein
MLVVFVAIPDFKGHSGGRAPQTKCMKRADLDMRHSEGDAA